MFWIWIYRTRYVHACAFQWIYLRRDKHKFCWLYLTTTTTTTTSPTITDSQPWPEPLPLRKKQRRRMDCQLLPLKLLQPLPQLLTIQRRNSVNSIGPALTTRARTTIIVASWNTGPRIASVRCASVKFTSYRQLNQFDTNWLPVTPSWKNEKSRKPREMPKKT